MLVKCFPDSVGVREAAIKELNANVDDIAPEYDDPEHVQLTALAEGVEERTKAKCADRALYPALSPFVKLDEDDKPVWIPWAPQDSVAVAEYHDDGWMRSQLSWRKHKAKMPNLAQLLEIHRIFFQQTLCPPHDPLFSQVIADKGGKDKFKGINLHFDEPFAGIPVITHLSDKRYHIRTAVSKHKETLKRGCTYAVGIEKFWSKPHGFYIEDDKNWTIRIASHFMNDEKERALMEQFKLNAANGMEHSAVTLHERQFDAKEAVEYKSADKETRILMDILRYSITTPPNDHINPKMGNKAAYAQTLSEWGKVGATDRHQKKRRISEMNSVKAQKGVELRRHKKAKTDIENKEESDD